MGGGCGLAVSFTYPLNPDATTFRRVPAGWIPRHADQAAEREGRRRLRRYYRRMEFRRVAGTRFDGLLLTRPVPSLSDLLRGPG